MWDHIPLSALQPGSGERMMQMLTCSMGPYMVTAGLRTAHGWLSIGGELSRQWSRN
jgi:hypothetical protein